MRFRCARSCEFGESAEVLSAEISEQMEICVNFASFGGGLTKLNCQTEAYDPSMSDSFGIHYVAAVIILINFGPKI